MSTVAEHLALLEFFLEMRYDRDPANRSFSGFTNEASMFCDVHLKDLVASQSPASMEAARLDVEKRLREQHPAIAERLIAAWKAATVAQARASTTPATAPVDAAEFGIQGTQP